MAELSNNNNLDAWKSELKKVKHCPQRQDALNDQLKDLILIANKFGFYDAADYIKYSVLKMK